MEGRERKEGGAGRDRQHDADRVNGAVGDHFGTRIVPAPHERHFKLGIWPRVVHR